MDWRKYRHKAWVHGMKDPNGMNFDYMVAEVDDGNRGVLFVLPHYTKKYTIKGYSAWYQSDIHRNSGGDNFGVKIRKCSSFDEGRRLAEQYYEALKNNEEPKAIGTQYFDDDVVIDRVI